MAGGRFLSRDDPTISPDARVRASVGVGNDCEPYVDPLIGLSYPIAPPGVVLPSCFALDNTRGEPGVESILERVYAGATAQIKVDAIAQLERLALERFAAKQRALSMYNETELAFFREQQRRIDAGLPIITAAQLAPLTVRPAMGPVVSVGGSAMSAGSWFGLSGPTLVSSFPTNGFNSNMGFGFLPQLGDAVSGALPSLVGIAGQFFLAQQLQKQQEDAAKARLREIQALSMLGFNQNGPQVVVGPDGTLGMGPDGMPQQGPIWPFMPGTGACCPTRGAVSVSPSDAPGIYRQGCGPCSPVVTRNRFFALRADGTRDLFVKVGKVQSVSPRALNRFARRWAKEAGLTASKRGAGGRRGRRRPR